MARHTRPDAPGFLHHGNVNGVEKNPIFEDAWGYEHFPTHLGAILSHDRSCGVSPEGEDRRT